MIGLVVLLAIWAVFIGVFGLPFFKIIQRAGIDPRWIALVIVPFLGPVLLLGVLAFTDWPNEPEGYRRCSSA